MKQVIITVTPEGQTKFETTGYTGQECREVDLAMVRVGTIHNEQVTAEGCQPASLPAYNEIGLSRNQ